MIEEQVFLQAPPEALGWARQAGLPLLPQDYDVIAPLLGLEGEGASISAPEMFSSVSGRVPVLGTATGSNFDFYRLQFGQGLNPDRWLQIGEDGRAPVSDGRLALWDTSSLSGLFVLQLLVVGEDQRVEAALVQVTVDNQPPIVDITYPVEDQRLGIVKTVVLQAEASDDLQLSEVQFYVDDRLVLAIKAPPYAVPWNASAGEHRLRVRAIDRAGNTTEMEIKFVVGA